MPIKSSQVLVQEALNIITTIQPEEALKLFKNKNCNLIDIRDYKELQKEGRIENSLHIPRGMLEFWIDPESSYFKNSKLDINKEIMLFCAGGSRSALAAKTLKEMGFKKVSHVDGGYSSMKFFF